MIIGLKPTKESQPDAVYDYIGVLYPEGFISNEYNFLFNHEDINDVVFTGYNNPERESFVEFMQQAYDNLNKNQQNLIKKVSGHLFISWVNMTYIYK